MGREYVDRAISALNNGEHAKYFNTLIREYNYDNGTPITPEYIKDINSSCVIVINESVFRTICEINKITSQKNTEVPFFLFGREEEQGVIYFHIAKYYEKDLEKHAVSFKPLARGIDKAMWDYLQDNDAINFLSDFGSKKIPKFKRAVRCYGHTHPKDTTSDEFSLQDLTCTVEHTLLNKYYSSNEMGSLDLLITPSGDINFIKYESNELLEGFMKYQRVYVKMDDGRILKLPAYKNGNYEPKMIESRSR